MIIQADARAIPLADKSVQCVVTSPPYWNLRDYGTDGQLGLENTPEEYVENMVAVFHEVRRVLRKDGILWINLGDCYINEPPGSRDPERWPKQQRNNHKPKRRIKRPQGMKQKDLAGIPWRVAFALQDDGWWLRQDIIWHKPNPMPESVRDRCTKSHEYIFLMTKSAKYYYDAKAIAEPLAEASAARYEYEFGGTKTDALIEANKDGVGQRTRVRGNRDTPEDRNKRSVWSITTKPYKAAHFATFPPELPRLCILAGSKKGDVVLDPFSGSGTTAQVATELQRIPVGLDISMEYCRNLATKRQAQTEMFA